MEELKSEKGKISKGAIKDRIKEIKDDSDYLEEMAILEAFLELIDQETESGKKISQAQKELNAYVSAKYPTLAEKEVESLVVHDKWLVNLSAEVESEVEKISQNLTSRMKELAERYSDPLPKLEKELDLLSKKVDLHITNMGFEWM